jgi:tetratricopeptide (TPR) repeat protein
VAAAEGPILKALELNPDLADVQYTLGLYYWRQGNSSGGEAFARAVELNANHADALAAHAKWIWHQQDFDRPGPHFERAKDVDPLSLIRYAELGTFYGYQNDMQATLAVAEEIKQRFRTPEAMEVIARLYELVGRLDEAIAWAWRGRQLARPQMPDPTWQLAELYARLGMHEVVEELIPGPDISKYYWQRRYVDLIEVAEEAIIERPEEAKIYYQLAFAYTTQNAHAAAARILRLAGLPDSVYADSRRADSVEAMATYAVALYQLGEAEEAHDVASWHRDRMQIALETKAADSWWPNVYQACELVILDEPQVALERLGAMLRSHGFAWEPFLKDAVCFRSLQNQEVYQSVLAEIGNRKRKLRDQLPQTLAAHGLGSTQALLAGL